jgi:outer membrane receptor protein involved in Fe transport
MIKMQYKLKTGFFLLFICRAFSLFSIDSPGEIAGSVKDAKTSEAIIGATVWVKGSDRGAVTDSDGYFSIKGLTEDRYTLIISYLSYKTVETECEVKGSVTQLDIRMESDEQMIEEVVVNARMRSYTENSMVLTVKSLPQIANGISASQIARGPDRVAAEVIRRIPGITVLDDRFIIVRGLSQRYNNAWMNGLAVPSTETDQRAFPFDLIPGSQIDHLLVYKSPSPELPADFAGGFVKITSKSIPDENRMEFSYTTGFNVKTPGHAFRINPGSRTDFVGFDLNKRPLPASFPAQMDAVSGNPEELTRLTREGFNNDWRIKNVTPLPDQRLSLMIARRMETKRHHTVGNVTALTYSYTFKEVEQMMNARYGIYSAAADRPVFLDHYTDSQFSNDARVGLLHNWSFILNPSHRIEFKNLLNILGRNRLTERSGIKDMSSMYYREQTEMLYSSRLTYGGQFAGMHNFGAHRTFAWDAGYSLAIKNEPDRRIVTNQTGISNPDEPVKPQTENDNITRYFQHLNDHSVALSLNYTQTLAIPMKPVLKTGIYAEYRNRAYTQREFIYRYDKLTYEERRICLRLPFQEMLDNRYLGADKIYVDEITRKTNAYSAGVLHAAGYAAVEIPFGHLTAYAGVRFESYHTRLNRDRSDAPDVILKTTMRVDEPDLLPSVNLNYRFNDRHQLRAAYGRSLNRPELRELSPAVYFDFDLFSEIGGNENLKTASINQADLRYEFYPGIGETVSLGVFYKHFRNPIEWTFIDMGGSLRYNYENADRAESFGVELDLRKKLDFLGMPDFSLTLNAALIESSVHFKPGEIVSEPDRNMQGQSPYVVNTGLFYQSGKWGLNASLLYNRIGKRIVGLGKSNSIKPDMNSLIPDAYEMPRNVFDFVAGKTLGKGFEIRFSIKDILSEDITYKQFPRFEIDGVIHRREQVTRRFNPGQSFSVGISFSVN